MSKHINIEDDLSIPNYAIHDEKRIQGFFGSYRFLANFYPSTILFAKKKFPSIENCYQAAKGSPANYGDFMYITAGQAKKLGKQTPNFLKREWDDAKLSLMTYFVFFKFMNHEDLATLLLATGNRYLEETNSWHDIFWGVYNGEGENHLGKILMQVRSVVRYANDRKASSIS